MVEIVGAPSAADGLTNLLCRRQAPRLDGAVHRANQGIGVHVILR